MTLAELERWSLDRNWASKRKLELAQHLRHQVPLITNNLRDYSMVDGLTILSG